jgi:DNA-binding CsgD family transcriptional regulator
MGDGGGRVLASPADRRPRHCSAARWRGLNRTSKEIARTLSISVATVNRHVANLYSKIDARNRTEATRWAPRRGRVSTDPEAP